MYKREVYSEILVCLEIFLSEISSGDEMNRALRDWDSLQKTFVYPVSTAVTIS